jgi:hypothetical protein
VKEPLTVAKRKISQNLLAQIAKKKSLIEQLQEQVKAAEATVLEQLKAGAPVASGLLTARIKTWQRRNVAWKQVLVREKGEDFVDRVFNGTRPDDYESLVVELA